MHWTGNWLHGTILYQKMILKLKLFYADYRRNWKNKNIAAINNAGLKTVAGANTRKIMSVLFKMIKE